MIHWGQKLREMVEFSGVSKGDVAKALEITPGALSSSFGSETLRIDTVFRICSACHVKPWQFIASIESGLDPVLFRVIDLIINLPVAERSYVFKGIEREVEYILASRGKAVDAAKE